MYPNQAPGYSGGVQYIAGGMLVYGCDLHNYDSGKDGK